MIFATALCTAPLVSGRQEALTGSSCQPAELEPLQNLYVIYAEQQLVAPEHLAACIHLEASVKSDHTRCGCRYRIQASGQKWVLLVILSPPGTALQFFVVSGRWLVRSAGAGAVFETGRCASACPDVLPLHTTVGCKVGHILSSHKLEICVAYSSTQLHHISFFFYEPHLHTLSQMIHVLVFQVWQSSVSTGTRCSQSGLFTLGLAFASIEFEKET